MENKKIGILVVSNDKYSDLWEPFFQAFFKFWSDCPYDIYLVSNFRTFNKYGIHNILVGKDISWSDNLISALRQFPYDYLILFIEDLFIVEKVNTEEVKKTINWAIENDVNYLRLIPSQKPDKPFNNLVGMVSPGTIYRTSTQLPVWKKEVLLKLLRNGESAWEFEYDGSKRSDEFDKFFSTWTDTIKIINGVVKGKWVPSALKKIMQLGIDVDISVRKKMNFFELIKYYFGKMRSLLLNLLPPRYRRDVRDYFRKNNI